MFDLETGWMSENTDRTHVTAATAACALSFGLHLAAFFCLSGVQIKVPVASMERFRARRVRSRLLVDVKRETLAKKPRPPMLRPGESAFTADLAEEAGILGVPPGQAAIEPPAVTENRLAGETQGIAVPDAVPKRKPWKPGPGILMITKQIAADEFSPLKRKLIPAVERLSETPDVVAPVDREGMKKAGMLPALTVTGRKPRRVVIAQETLGGRKTRAPDLVIGESPSQSGSELFMEKASEVTALKPIENLLSAEVSTYTTFRDWKHGYFKIKIKRAGAETLPVMPKDILLVQDCSASMAEKRLHFCRDGLIRCLSEIGPKDRFNVVNFRDSSKMCFKEWAETGQGAVGQAKRFVRKMKSEGNTDIFSSIKDLMDMKRVPGRPVIVLLVTDGRSTTGLTRSSDIIGQFSKLNNGAVSVFAMGTVQTADSYLLDLLTYCNRGGSLVVTGGRWSIPDSMHEIMREISRPVLSDVKFGFSADSRCAVYPVLTANLYLDRTLVLYGRYPRGTKNIIFQAVGRAGDVECDMVFNLALDKATKSRDKNIRRNWAKQKVYHLIGEYARSAAPEILKQITGTAKAYRLKIPYKGKF